MNPIPVTSSRLQRVFTDLAVVNVELSSKQFADKLGELISLSDAIVLAESLRSLKKAVFGGIEHGAAQRVIYAGARWDAGIYNQ